MDTSRVKIFGNPSENDPTTVVFVAVFDQSPIEQAEQLFLALCVSEAIRNVLGTEVDVELLKFMVGSPGRSSLASCAVERSVFQIQSDEPEALRRVVNRLIELLKQREVYKGAFLFG